MLTQSIISEQALLEVARQGDVSPLITYIYTEKLRPRAVKLAHNFQLTYGAHLDAEDIMGAGVECVLRGMQKALDQARNPIGWLLWGAQLAMLHFCQETRSPIRVPASMQHVGRKVPAVFSLDAPLSEDGSTLLDLVSDEDWQVSGYA